MNGYDERCRRCGGRDVNGHRLCPKCDANEKFSGASDTVVWQLSRDRQWAAAGEVREIADDLRAGFHQALEGAYFYYVFARDTPTVKGRAVWGRVKIVGGLPAYLMSRRYPESGPADPFFVMEVAWEVWQRIGYVQRIALVDHLLSHCWLRDGLKPSLCGTDVSEFTSVIRRQGVWTDQVREMLDAAKEADEAPLLAATVGIATARDFH